jgi:hypothetical protein
MGDIEFMYMGKQIAIHEEHPNAVISVDGREFHCHHHQPEEDSPGLAMWMCDEAYFASPDIRELAKHFADYGYMFDDPGRIVVNEAGEVVDHTKKRGIDAEPPVKKTTAKKTTAKKGTSRSSEGHSHGGGS